MVSTNSQIPTLFNRVNPAQAKVRRVQGDLTVTGSVIVGDSIVFPDGTEQSTASPVTGAGTATEVAFWSDADTLTSTDALTFSGGNLTTSAPTWNFTGSTQFDINTGSIFELRAEGVADGDGRVVAQYTDLRTSATGVGGGVQLAGRYTAGGDIAGFGGIRAMKKNSTSGDFGADLILITRPTGGNQTERIRILSTGLVGIGTSSPGTQLAVSGGFATAMSATTLNTAGPTLTVANRTYVSLTLGASSSGNITLSDGLHSGQWLVIECAANSGTAIIPDNTANNVKLSADWNPTADDTLTLIWNGSDWVELARSAN